MKGKPSGDTTRHVYALLIYSFAYYCATVTIYTIRVYLHECPAPRRFLRYYVNGNCIMSTFSKLMKVCRRVKPTGDAMQNIYYYSRHTCHNEHTRKSIEVMRAANYIQITKTLNILILSITLFRRIAYMLFYETTQRFNYSET